METIIVVIEALYAGSRLDKALSCMLPDFSRNRIQQLLEQGMIETTDAQDTIVKDASYKVKAGQHYCITLPSATPSTLTASDVVLDIVYEDGHLLVINKPAGMTVHPAPGHYDDTLVNALLGHCGESLSGIGGVIRPGIVHRIDKDTSGLLVVAKHDAAHRHLAEQLATRTLKREYLAVVKGRPNPLAGTIEGNIGRSTSNRQKMAVLKSNGKPALTHYMVKELYPESALVACKLETGRTHQIRVHLSHIGYPIIGDSLYGRKGKAFNFPRQALHAERLTLIHPQSERLMEFTAAVPDDMQSLIHHLQHTE